MKLVRLVFLLVLAAPLMAQNAIPPAPSFPSNSTPD